MEKQDLPKPPKHGVIKTNTCKAEHAKQHLANMKASMNEVKSYHNPGDIGYASQSGFTGSGMSGGASGSAEYETTSTGNTGDCYSGGPSGY